MTLETVAFDLKATLSEVTHLLEIRARAKGLTLVTTWDPVTPQHVVGDPVRFRQVITNLIGNAIKFTETGSLRVEVTGSVVGGLANLHLAIQDTGIGIAPDALTRIFDKFAQADDSTTRRFGGTGLGLAIASELVKLMGGTLDVESTVGKGSTFTLRFTLPIGDPVPSAPAAAASIVLESELAARGHTVLLAEDNPVNQKVATRLLEKLGCRVVVASSGREAVRLRLQQPYDLVCMDCQMPEMDGYEATAAIRLLERDGKAPGGAIPIVALTANAMEGDREECLAAGMDDYVRKPIRREDLIRVLDTWAGRTSGQPFCSVLEHPSAS